jgi:hypothetical protein
VVLVPGVPRIVRQRAHLRGESLRQDVTNVRSYRMLLSLWERGVCQFQIFLCWSENSFLNNICILRVKM